MSSKREINIPFFLPQDISIKANVKRCLTPLSCGAKAFPLKDYPLKSHTVQHTCRRVRAARVFDYCLNNTVRLRSIKAHKTYEHCRVGHTHTQEFIWRPQHVSRCTPKISAGFVLNKTPKIDIVRNPFFIVWAQIDSPNRSGHYTECTLFII